MSQTIGNIVVDRGEIETFKSKWPCHGFADTLAVLVFEFDSNLDLVDERGWDETGGPLDTRDFDCSGSTR